MKKLLILILIALVLTLTIFTVVQGFEIGGLTVLGIRGIQEKNIQLEQKLEQATKLTSKDYPNKINEINTNVKQMEQQKVTYEDMVAVSTTDEIQSATQFQKYTIEYLWTNIGTHATSEGVIIKMDVTNGTGGTDTYNLNFTVNGSYVGISEFIRAIEDDSTLGFKIEEFNMKPGSDDNNNLQATFVCKNITITDIKQVSNSTEENKEENTKEINDSNTTNSTNTNSTNSTNSANSTNSTNSSNTTNTANTTNSTNTNR